MKGHLWRKVSVLTLVMLVNAILAFLAEVTLAQGGVLEVLK